MGDLRLVGARDALATVDDAISAALSTPDPVEQRRQQVRIAQRLRAIAEVLDDFGRLTE